MHPQPAIPFHLWLKLVLSMVLVTATETTRGGVPLYVSEPIGDEVAVVGADGTVGFFADVPAAQGIAVDANGNVYMASRYSGTIYVMNSASRFPSGRPTPFAALGVQIGGALAFDTGGNLYAATSSGIDKVTPSGVISTFSTVVAGGLAFDKSGNLFCTTGNPPGGFGGIDKITPSGVVTQFVGGLSYPLGLAFDNSGDLYVSENLANLIVQITPSGSVTPFGGTIPQPFGVTFGTDGNLYAASETPAPNYTLATAIYQITPTGTTTQFADMGGTPMTFICSVPEPSSVLLCFYVLSALIRRRRQAGGEQLPQWLTPIEKWPVEAPGDWATRVDRPETPAELEAVRQSVKRGRPLGDDRWQRRTAAKLGLESTLRKRGRPRVRPVKDAAVNDSRPL